MNEKRYYKQYQDLLKKHDKVSYRAVLNSFKSQFNRIANDYLISPNTPLELLVKEDDTLQLLLQIYFGIGVEMASNIYKSLGKQRKSFNLILETKASPLNVSTPENPQVNTNYWKQEFIRFSQSKECAKKVSQVTKTTKEQIRKVIENSVEKGLSAVNTAKEIQKQANSITTKKRALLIARTENTVSSNYGAMAGAKASGLVLYKKWIVRSGDSKTRDAHLGMIDKEPIPMDQLFEVGGQKMNHPGDNKHGASASNICNCRCVLAFIPASEVIGKAINNPPVPQKLPDIEVSPELDIKPDENEYTEAKTVKEAEELIIKRGIAKSVDYSFVKDIKVANEINRTLFNLKNEFDFNPIDIKKMDRSGMNKGALMSANGGVLNINPSMFKDLKKLSKIHLSSTENYRGIILKNIEIIKRNIEFTKGRAENYKWVNELKKHEAKLNFERFTVSYSEETVIKNTVNHEFGHILTDQRTGLQNELYFLDKKHLNNVDGRLFKKEYVNELNREWVQIYNSSMNNGDIYRISKYASTNHKELFSESFVMYRNNDSNLPKVIKEFMDKYFSVTK